MAARNTTAHRLIERRDQLSKLSHGNNASIVLMGSWGRAEVTSGSDDDFMILLDRDITGNGKPTVEDVAKVLNRDAGNQGIFSVPVEFQDLAENIGLDRDDNSNLTRRMLLLLESTPLTGRHLYESAHRKVLKNYLDKSVKDWRPPRFLLNDVVRYWRTVCVDFAGKERSGPGKWGLRNAKLRTSRKMLFASGLLPVLDCYQLSKEQIADFLTEQFSMPPTDRIAASFLRHGRADAGSRTLGAYDEFLGMLDDSQVRAELESVTRDSVASSQDFATVRRLGGDLQAGLAALLFETDPLRKVVREYAIF